jgi:hypothetical protein
MWLSGRLSAACVLSREGGREIIVCGCALPGGLRRCSANSVVIRTYVVHGLLKARNTHTHTHCNRISWGLQDAHDQLLRFLGQELGFTPRQYDTWDNRNTRSGRGDATGDSASANADQQEQEEQPEGEQEQLEGRQPRRRRPRTLRSQSAVRPIAEKFARPALEEIDSALVMRMREQSEKDQRLYEFAKLAAKAYADEPHKGDL